jgi:hypothetical protein
MRSRTIVALGLLLGFMGAPGAYAQILDARRLAMGGVATSENKASLASNIAFRAVPSGIQTRSIPLPVGLFQVLHEHPTFDTSDPDFNAFELLNLVSNPPLTLSISKPEEISSDISIFVARDSLRVDLEDVQRAIPENGWTLGGVYHMFAIGVGVKNFFVQVVPTTHIRNEFTLDDALERALKDAEAFTGNTRYGTHEDGEAQQFVAWQVGAAIRPLYSLPSDANEGDQDDPLANDPRRNGATALYVGGAPKYLWGLAYGSLKGTAGITTGDTLFGSGDPVAIDMAVRMRHSAFFDKKPPGSGFGADVGAVFFHKNYELGVGVNDLGSQIRWKTTVLDHVYSDSTNEFTTTVIGRDDKFTSRVPVAVIVNAARRSGSMTLAADMVASELKTQIHVGLERWLGMWALRAGSYCDQNGRWQFTGGSGVRFGSLGLDVALATHSRNVEEVRAAELCASFTLYP